MRLADVVLRPLNLADEGERALVFKSWLRTQVGAPPLGKHLPRSIHAQGLHRVVERLLAIGSVVAAEWEGIVVAYACTEDERVHYVFTKNDYRRRGLSRLLLAAHLDTRAIYTHKPQPQRAAYVRIPSKWTFQPYAAWT